MWAVMSDSDKQPYVDMVAQDRLRYKDQRRELLTKGYFTLEDGSKSTDSKNQPKPQAQVVDHDYIKE